VVGGGDGSALLPFQSSGDIFQQMLPQQGEESTQENFRDCFRHVSQGSFKDVVHLPPRTGRDTMHCVGNA